VKKPKHNRQTRHRLARGKRDNKQRGGLAVNVVMEPAKKDKVQRRALEQQFDRKQQPNGIAPGKQPVNAESE